jgi:hypothetical protein
MATDPEELLRSIERTREEVARTVDTIAERLDPKQVAKRGAATVRSRADAALSALRGAPAKLRSAPSKLSSAPARLRGGSASDALGKVTPYVKSVPKPALGAGVAALAALAAIIASRRKR